MAVIQLRELRDRTGKYSTKSGESVRTFEVYTDSASDTQHTVVNGALAFGLPALFEVHPSNSLERVDSIEIRQREGTSKFWIITIRYSTATPSEDQKKDDPVDEPVKRSGGSQKIQVPLTKDIDGTACLNAAGVAFDPPIEVRRSLQTLTFVRNEASPPNRRAWIDKVNSDPFSGAPAGTVYCEDITFDEQFKNGISYWAVTYVFVEDPRGWQPRPLNQGFQQLVGGELQRITDRNGEPMTDPVPLDADGVQIPTEDLPAAAIHLEFQGYETVDFNALGLPA